MGKQARMFPADRCTYEITVQVAGNEDEVYLVAAQDEGTARSAAMARYVQPLTGQQVTYRVLPL